LLDGDNLMNVTNTMDADTATPCLPPEVLATFAEGRLTRAERATVVVHLADCADCREVVAETVAFLDEDGWEEDEPAARPEETGGTVVPGPWRRWVRVVVPLAAVVLVGVGVVAFWSDLTGDDPVDRVQVASRLDWEAIPDDAREPSYEATMRGGPEEGRQIAPPALVRIGAALLDLEVAARAGEKPWDDERVGLQNEFGKLEFAQAWVRMVEEMEPEDLAGFELQLRERVADDAVFLDLGLWAEAGRLATLGRDLETLRSEEMTRFARAAVRSKLLRADLPADARPALEAAADVLARGATTEDLGPLRQQFEDILFFGGTKASSA
jgi:hypothetical protein